MFSLPALPYSLDALEPYIDQETMRIHHGKHHATYIENLNKLIKGDEKIEDLVLSDNPKIKNNAGGHFNHTFFWQIMAPIGKTAPVKEIVALKDKFIETALGRFGSGWAWIVVKDNKLSIIDTPNQDTPLSVSTDYRPILGVDVWEHAYYLKYQNRRAEYLENWWKVINWLEVVKRLR